MMQSARLEILSNLNLYNIACYIRTHVYNKRMMLTVNCLPRVLCCNLFIKLGPSMRQSPRLENLEHSNWCTVCWRRKKG